MSRNLPNCLYFDLLKEKCKGLQPVFRASVTLKSPSSIANLGSGFDVVGVALNAPSDILDINVEKGSGNIEVFVEGENVPEGKSNLVYFIIENFLKACGLRQSLDVEARLRKGIPVSMGLGSSAASSVAAVEALRLVLGLELDERERVLVASCGELYAAGSLHYDNVSPSYLGGTVLIDHNSMSFIKLPALKSVYFAVVMPIAMKGKEGKTMIARKLIPEKIGVRESIRQNSALGKLIASLFLNDVKMFGEAASVDYIAEPYRKSMIPYYDDLKRIALENGGLGFNIAGAGPSVFVVLDDKKKAENLGKLLAEYLEGKGVSSGFFVASPSSTGVAIERIIRSP